MAEAAEQADPLEELGRPGEDASELRNTELSSRRLKKLQDAQRHRGMSSGRSSHLELHTAAAAGTSPGSCAQASLTRFERLLAQVSYTSTAFHHTW